jgi:hypothetical protein
MASSIEDILLAKAMAESEKRPDPGVAMAGGAAVGTTLGVAAGTIPHRIGTMLGAKASMRPGFRMAGGLVGAITGGALGAGVANMFKQSSPAGNMLATIQAQGGNLDTMQRNQLQAQLADYYTNNLGM